MRLLHLILWTGLLLGSHAVTAKDSPYTIDHVWGKSLASHPVGQATGIGRATEGV